MMNFADIESESGLAQLLEKQKQIERSKQDEIEKQLNEQSPVNDDERKAVCLSQLSQPRFQTTVTNTKKSNFRLGTQSKTVQLPDTVGGTKRVKLSTLETAVDQIKEIVELEEVYQSQIP